MLDSYTDIQTGNPQNVSGAPEFNSVDLQQSGASDVLDQSSNTNLTVDQVGQPLARPAVNVASVSDDVLASVLIAAALLLALLLLIGLRFLRRNRQKDVNIETEEQVTDLESQPKPVIKTSKVKSSKKRSAPNQLKKKSQRKKGSKK